MASRVADVVIGALKIKGVPETFCFESMTELLKSLPQFFVVELPLSLTNVVTGSQTPNEDETNKIWNRRTGSGASKGLWVFSSGKWVLAQGVPTGVIEWWYAADGKAPDGYKKIDAAYSGLPLVVRNQLIASYIQDGAGMDIFFAIIRV